MIVYFCLISMSSEFKKMSNTKAEECTQLLMQCVLKTKQYYRANGETNVTLLKIFAKLAEFHYDKGFLLTMKKHLDTIEETLRQKVISSRIKNLFNSQDACLQYYIAVFFLDKIGKFSNSTLPFNINYIQPIISIPLEAFLKPDKVSVQKFVENLERYDVVFAEVVSTEYEFLDTTGENREYIVLRIISKINDDNILYHLDIKVHLFKQQELARLGEGHFKLAEILPVVMFGSVTINGVLIHYGTTNMSILNKSEKSIDLDSLRQKRPAFDLSLFKEAKKYSCYAQYLESMIHFNEKQNLINGIKSLGLDPYHIYSFNAEEDGLISPKGFHIGALKNAAHVAQQKESNNYLEEGNRFVQSGDISKALSAFEEALKIWPKNYKVFECRGQMYADIQNKQFCDLKKATLDFTAALEINPNIESVKKNFSDVYVCIAKKLISKMKYTESKKNLQAALILNKDNQKANVLLRKINKKLSSSSSKSGDPELIALQRKREILLIALDKE